MTRAPRFKCGHESGTYADVEFRCKRCAKAHAREKAENNWLEFDGLIIAAREELERRETRYRDRKKNATKAQKRTMRHDIDRAEAKIRTLKKEQKSSFKKR